MRAISLVKRIEFKFTGNVVRDALTLGDVDNDGRNELIIGNQTGDIAIFRGREKLQMISKLSPVCCVSVGDVLNQDRNILVVITADGWCYLYAAPEMPKNVATKDDAGMEQVDGPSQSIPGPPVLGAEDVAPKQQSKKNEKEKFHLVCIHMQRIPANSKSILLGDVDGDGMIEMVLGLTDRVVRSYRWMANPHKPSGNITDSNLPFEPADKLLGKFVALNKWECANQIGSITLHHSLEGKPSLLIAQPGGTFMRIKCRSEDSISQEIETSGQSNSSSFQGESIPGSVDYQFLGISRMRNQNISTEILGDLKCSGNSSYDKKFLQKTNSDQILSKGRPYALATLDGTIMLVQNEVILWAFAVDHQVFALTKLDVTKTGSDDIIVCSWDGQTYILDQDKNSVRFNLNEAVQAFDCGYYNMKLDEPDVTCLVYVTFKNTIIIYYDIPLKELTCQNFEPDIEPLSALFTEEGRTCEEAKEIVKNMDKKIKRELIEYLLYKVK